MCIKAYKGVWNAIHSRGGICCEDELQGIGAFVPPIHFRYFGLC